MEYVVHVVESPKDADVLEGRQEGEALCAVLKQIGVEARHFTVVNTKCWYEALALVAFTHSDTKLPILHVSAHGNATGIALTSGETLKWSDVTTTFRELNKALDGGLLLCMSTCEGIGAYQMVGSRGDLPFHTLVGPTTNIDWSASLVAFCAFYREVARKKNAPADAVRVMNAAVDLPENTFVAVQAQAVQEYHRQRDLVELRERVQAATEWLRRQKQGAG